MENIKEMLPSGYNISVATFTMEKLPSEYTSVWKWKGKDPSIDSMFLMESPIPVTLILIAYLLMVVLGPKLLKNRPPFKLDKILLLYNAFQILASGTLFVAIIMYRPLYRDGILYAGCPLSKDTKDPSLFFGTWFYFITKITELLDTVFFILRKKNNQVTVLHVFHHSTMVLYMWSYLKYGAGGDGAILALLNCFVHIVMYSYYLLSGLGPRFQKFLWWKKYVTELQLVQFLIMLSYLTWTYFSPKCNFATAFTGFITFNVSVYLIMFLNFYINSYKNMKNKTKKSID